ncbi:hypothetical protein [Ensifer adhaerens]
MDSWLQQVTGLTPQAMRIDDQGGSIADQQGEASAFATSTRLMQSERRPDLDAAVGRVMAVLQDGITMAGIRLDLAGSSAGEEALTKEIQEIESTAALFLMTVDNFATAAPELDAATLLEQTLRVLHESGISPDHCQWIEGCLGLQFERRPDLDSAVGRVMAVLQDGITMAGIRLDLAGSSAGEEALTKEIQEIESTAALFLMTVDNFATAAPELDAATLLEQTLRVLHESGISPDHCQWIEGCLGGVSPAHAELGSIGIDHAVEPPFRDGSVADHHGEEGSLELPAEGPVRQAPAAPSHAPSSANDIPPSRENSVEREISEVLAAASRRKAGRTKEKYIKQINRRVDSLNEKPGRSAIDPAAVERLYRERASIRMKRSPEKRAQEDASKAKLVQNLFDKGLIAEPTGSAYTAYQRSNRAQELFAKGLIAEPTPAAYLVYTKSNRAQELFAKGLIAEPTPAAYSAYMNSNRAQELVAEGLIAEPTPAAYAAYMKSNRAQELFAEGLIAEPTPAAYAAYMNSNRAQELVAEGLIAEPTPAAYAAYVKSNRAQELFAEGLIAEPTPAAYAAYMARTRNTDERNQGRKKTKR